MQSNRELRVTLDSCIIYQVAACDTLLHLAEQNLFHPIWSQAILDEVKLASERNLSSLRQNGLASRIQDMNEYFKTSLFTPSLKLVQKLQVVLPDPEDAHVVSLALVSKSQFILTENLKDFPGKVLEPLGLQVLSFDTFMSLMLELDSVKVMKSLENLVGKKRNPKMTVLEHLLQLERISPNFNKQVRSQILNE
jgi:predicted nucleic acid-binding protein